MPRGRPKKRPDLCRYEDDDGITEEHVRIAKKRVMPHLHNMRLIDYNLETLLVSCYLQGLHDMGTSVAGMLDDTKQEFDIGGEG